MDKQKLVMALSGARTSAINDRNADLAEAGLWPENQWRPSAEHDVDAILAEIKAQGYVIVPEQPDEIMVEAMKRAWRETSSPGVSVMSIDGQWRAENAKWLAVHRAMLSALEDQ